jgi:hypothetical protein
MLEFLWYCLVTDLDPTELVLDTSDDDWGQFVELD